MYIFYDTFDNSSFQVYAKVSVFVCFFSWYVYDFFIGFLGLWNNEIDFSIFLLPIFLLKLTISHVEGQVQWYISLISVFFAWAHLIIEFSLCLLTYCFFPVMILLTIFSFVLVMGFSFLDTLLKCLIQKNNCFSRLRYGKSVSNSQNQRVPTKTKKNWGTQLKAHIEICQNQA